MDQHNRVTLDQLAGLPVKQAANLSIEELAMLYEDLAELKAKVKSYDYTLHSVLTSRFSDDAADKRAEDGKNTGTVRLENGDYTIIVDLPKSVEWDQKLLAQSIEAIKKMGEPMDQYVTIKYGVSETKWNAWPESLREIFAPARSVGTGRETFKIERKGK